MTRSNTWQIGCYLSSFEGRQLDGEYFFEFNDKEFYELAEAYLEKLAKRCRRGNAVAIGRTGTDFRFLDGPESAAFLKYIEVMGQNLARSGRLPSNEHGKGRK